MEPKDLSYYIAEISKNYIYPDQPEAVSTLEDIAIRLLRYFADFLNSLYIHIPYPNHENVMAMYIMLAVFVIAFIAITFMVQLLIRSVKENTEKTTARKIVDANLEPLLDSKAWLSVAEELASEKNFRSACRAVFLAALLSLDEMSIAEFIPHLSNYEYLYKLSAVKSIQESVKELSYKVDLIWFGNHEAGASDYQHCLSLNRKIYKQAESIAQGRLLNAQ